MRLNIRKLAHVPAPSVARPTAMETKSFMLSSKAMQLQVTLSKPVRPPPQSSAALDCPSRLMRALPLV